jgi:hypothetical protein
MKMRQLLTFLLISATEFFAFGQTGSISGRVYNTATNEPMPFTNIIVWEQPEKGATSDLDGNFTIHGLQPGFVRLKATAVGFEDKFTEEVMVTNAKIEYVDIPMVEKTYDLNAVVVKASPFVRNEESPLSMQTLGIAEIEKNPGSNRDISKVVQILPGVGSTPAYRNDLIVRGGGASENRFFLDGVEIPYLNHFSTQGASGGPVGIINVDFIREVNFYSGAFPADRGNALSSVIEFEQKDGNRDRAHIRAIVGASDLGLTLDGPLGEKTTYIFSLRRSYLQFLFNALGLPFLPTYNDYQFKVKHDFNLKNQLSIISIGALDNSKLNTGIKNPDESQRYILGYLPVNKQWSYAIGAVYRHFRQKGYDTWVLSRNMLNNRIYKYEDNVEDDPSKLILNLQSQEMENKFRYENNTRWGKYNVNIGAGAEYDKYINDTYQKLYIWNQLEVLDYNSYIDMFRWSLFGQVSRNLIKERLALSLGVRMDAGSFSGEMSNLFRQVSPRFSASYALTSMFFFNFNTGRYYQLPPYTMMGYRDDQARLINKINGLTYISVDHVVGGFELLPDEHSKVSLEAFYKYYRHYPFSLADSVSMASKSADYGVYGAEPVVSTSKGRAYGLELLYRNTDLMGFNLLLSYTLVRSEFTNATAAYIPSAWDNINLFNITVLKKLYGNWEAGLKWRYVGGAPYTPADLDKSSLRTAWDVRNQAYPDYTRYNRLRLRAFHQLDIRVDKAFFFPKWSLMLYVDVQNVYNFKVDIPPEYTNLDANGNPMIDSNDPSRYILRQVHVLSGTVIPTVGIIIEY